MLFRSQSLSRCLPCSAHPEHFRITVGETRRGFGHLPCLLARAWSDGKFELLNPAWRVLGYSDQELTGSCVCELVALGTVAACAAVRSLLTEGRPEQFGLRCKDGRQLRFHWNREFDDFTTSMFIIADELPAALTGTCRASPDTSARAGRNSLYVAYRT
jgi:hypothetical protein